MSATTVSIESLTYRYPATSEPAVRDISLEVPEGQILLITGPTGCGKSTLLKCLNGLIPHASDGVREGFVRVHGREVGSIALAECARHVGLIFQSPEDQVFSTSVEDEVAFGLENLGTPRAEMDRRVQEALDQVGLGRMRLARVAELSGGMKQRLAIAAVLAMGNRILLLDEPLSQLDPRGAQEVLQTLRRLRAERGMTILLAEHRLDDVVEFCDRVVLIEQGRIVLDEPCDRAFSDLAPYERLGLRIPDLAELYALCGRPERPLSRDVNLVLEDLGLDPGRPGARYGCEAKPRDPLPPITTLTNVFFRYAGQERDALSRVQIEIYPGEVLALMGANGCGKSTLLLLLAGLLVPSAGSVTRPGQPGVTRRGSLPRGHVGLVLQNPDLMLQAETVRDEVAFGPLHLGLSNPLQRAAAALSVMGLSDLADRSPLALSRGQRQRTATASVLSFTPPLLLLDEPTTGQNRAYIDEMMNALCQEIRGAHDRALVFSTHDAVTAAAYADRVALMIEGCIRIEGPPGEVFADSVTLQEACIRAPRTFQIALAAGLSPCFRARDLADRLRKPPVSTEAREIPAPP
ncbi:MAG: energy-coupling factor ABC transporter ATP-binding protein [Planctomycetes bacterium]|nr:energy-coupling factor ABC transporter ATP-binding protein [Planctomycetota bacterium]